MIEIGPNLAQALVILASIAVAALIVWAARK